MALNWTRFGGAALAALIALGAGAAMAQDGSGLGLSDTQTNRVVESMRPGMETCAKVDTVYRVDCFQQVYRAAARLLGSNAGYWEAEVALTRVGRNLSNFVRENGDSSADKIKAGGMRLKPVTKASLPDAGRVYQDNVTRAEDDLRGGTAMEQKYFAPIADLVGQYRTALPR